MANEYLKNVLRQRYLQPNEESVEDMYRRVAERISSNYAERDNFFDLMRYNYFLPNSPTLMNAGTNNEQLSACFVIPIEDSMESIFGAVKNMALVQKSGGGTGFSFSNIRPRDWHVASTGGTASGPVSFMEVFNAATNTVKQGGKRRGANMAILHVEHPDIEEFITCKDDPERFTNFNISVALTDAFMAAVERDEPFMLKFEGVTEYVSAFELFELVVRQAHKNGEPGVLFIDRVNEHNPNPELGDIDAVNPCGEQPLLPWESCNLGSINLYQMLSDGEVDWTFLERTTRRAVRFLEGVREVTEHPLPEIEEATNRTRKLGLGVMGFADMLAHLDIDYDTTEARALGAEIMRVIHETAHDESCKISHDKGLRSDKPFHATLTTIAPTGTISMIAGCSSGIEPLYATEYQRQIDNEIHTVPHPTLQDMSEERRKRIKTAHDISPADHIDMQAAFQPYVDNAISKTINLPAHATEEDVWNVYFRAWKAGCKGVTVYRDGSRTGQTLSKATPTPTQKESSLKRTRPRTTYGHTTKTRTGCGKLYVTVNSDQDGTCEVFTATGRTGGCYSQSEATSRLVSLALRAGVDTEEIIEQLRGIRCPAALKNPEAEGLSCPDLIGQTLAKDADIALQVPEPRVDSCPDCGKELQFESGCITCRNCGYSKCG